MRFKDKGVSPEVLSSAFEDFKAGQTPHLAAERGAAPAESANETIQKSMRLLLLVRAYQARGAAPPPRRALLTPQSRR